MSYNPAETSNFNLQEFNAQFDTLIQQSKTQQAILDEQQLNYLNNTTDSVKPWNLSISDILVNMKKSWFELFSDIYDFQVSNKTFLDDNRLFYFGLSMIIFVLTIYITEMIFV